MSHEIVGFAGAPKVLLQFRQRWRDCRVVDLSGRKELAFIPFPDGLAVEAAEEAGKSVPDDFHSERNFGPARLQHLAGYSRDGPFAWIRTDYFGGAGYQAAILGPMAHTCSDPTSCERRMKAAAPRPNGRSTARCAASASSATGRTTSF